MKIYKISQTENDDWDTYDSAVVYAENEEEAKKIHPAGYHDEEVTNVSEKYSSWTTLDNVVAEYIGEAKDGVEKGVIVGSFNAG